MAKTATMYERKNHDLRTWCIRGLLLVLPLSFGLGIGDPGHPARRSQTQEVPHDRTSATIAHFLPIGGPFQPDGPQPVQLGDAGNAAIPDDWYNTITADIAASEYHINWQEGVGAFQSPNRQQDLRITYRPDGFALTPRVADSTWSVALTLDRIGRPGAWLLPSDTATLSTNGPALVADHGSFAIDYHNGEEGMRQKVRYLGC